MAEPADKEDVKYLTRQIDSDADRLQNDIITAQDNVLNRLFTMGRDTMDLRAQVTSLGVAVKDAATISALQTEKAVLQNTIEIAKQTTYLSDKIDDGNRRTAELINTLKEADLNRMLIERNALIVEEAAERRHWRHAADQGQWAQLQSQIQNFNSQLSDAKASMVNFGTMAGVGQSSTSNNVR